MPLCVPLCPHGKRRHANNWFCGVHVAICTHAMRWRTRAQEILKLAHQGCQRNRQPARAQCLKLGRLWLVQHPAPLDLTWVCRIAQSLEMLPQRCGEACQCSFHVPCATYVHLDTGPAVTVAALLYLRNPGQSGREGTPKQGCGEKERLG